MSELNNKIDRHVSRISVLRLFTGKFWWLSRLGLVDMTFSWCLGWIFCDRFFFETIVCDVWLKCLKEVFNWRWIEFFAKKIWIRSLWEIFDEQCWMSCLNVIVEQELTELFVWKNWTRRDFWVKSNFSVEILGWGSQIISLYEVTGRETSIRY